MPVKKFDEITPEWLTDILVSQGSLSSGHVKHSEEFAWYIWTGVLNEGDSNYRKK